MEFGKVEHIDWLPTCFGCCSVRFQHQRPCHILIIFTHFPRANNEWCSCARTANSDTVYLAIWKRKLFYFDNLSCVHLVGKSYAMLKLSEWRRTFQERYTSSWRAAWSTHLRFILVNTYRIYIHIVQKVSAGIANKC